MKITTIIENSTVTHNLLCSHGQALLIEDEKYKILFDVGEIAENLVYNLEQMKISRDDITHIVLSHNHIDHSGAMIKLKNFFLKSKLFITDDFETQHLKPMGSKYKYLKNYDSSNVNLSYSKNELEYLKNATVTTRGQQIIPNLYTTGSLDATPHEQSLIYNQKEKGINIILGCSHPGIEKIVEESINVTGNNKVRSIIGGLHLNKMDKTEVEKISKFLKRLNLEAIFTNHCTGIQQTIWLKEFLGDIVKFSKTFSIGVGNAIDIGDIITFDFA